MSEYIIALEQIQELVERSALEAIDGYKMGVAKQIWSFPKLPEIVRCRDCMKWHHIDTLDGVRYGECDEWKRADSCCVPATRESGFCAWGRRKADA